MAFQIPGGPGDDVDFHDLESDSSNFDELPPYPLVVEDEDLDSAPDEDSPTAIRQRMAEAGDVEGLLQELMNSKYSRIVFMEAARYLRHAMGVAAKRDPAGFTEFVTSNILAVLGNLIIRGGFYVDQMVTRQDAAFGDRREWTQSQELENYLPKLMALQLHFAEIAKLRASSQRLSELAHRQAQRVDKTPSPAPSRRRRSCRMKGKRK